MLAGEMLLAQDESCWLRATKELDNTGHEGKEFVIESERSENIIAKLSYLL